MTYTWDADKNKTSESITGVMSGFGFTAGGQNVATDVKGNITTLPAILRPAGATTAMNLTWDSDNKLRSADIDANGTADVNFQYDALGRRVARTGTGGSVVDVQMDQQTIADYPVGGAATTPTFRYVYASYIDEPVVRKGPTSTSTAHFYHRNHQYSVTAITTSTGAIAERYAYTAYGQPTILNASGTPLSPQTSTLNSRYSYTGREWDATLGLHHFRARWMSPSAGRFLGKDPIGYEGSKWDLYEYVGSRPTTKVDPSGTVPISCGCSCDRFSPEGTLIGIARQDVTIDCNNGDVSGCCSRACGSRSSEDSDGYTTVCSPTGRWSIAGTGIDIGPIHNLNWLTSACCGFCVRATGQIVDAYMTNITGIPHLNDLGGNAYKHCLVNCLSTRRCGRHCAQSFWDGREIGGDITNIMDLHNNQLGRNITGDCETGGLNAWRTGQLICVLPEAGTPLQIPCPGPEW